MGDNEDEKEHFGFKVNVEENGNKKCINMIMKYGLQNKQITINIAKINFSKVFSKVNCKRKLDFIGAFNENTVFKKIILLKQDNKIEESNYVIYINSPYDYFNVIIYFWENQEQIKSVTDPIYIISGCYISRMERKDFYIKTELRINDKDIDLAIQDGKLNVSAIKGEHVKCVPYSTLDTEVSKNLDFRLALTNIIFGNQEKLICIAKHFDITALLAVSLSEVIRNPVMVFINLIAMRMNSLQVWTDFRNHLPPLAGGTWKNQQEFCPKFMTRLNLFFSKTVSETFSEMI